MKEDTQLVVVVILFIIIGMPVFILLVAKAEDYIVELEHKHIAKKNK